MEKTYRFIRIAETERRRAGNTKIYSVINRKSGYEIGTVEWYASWRQYCFLPADGTVFSLGCLWDIEDFIKLLKGESSHAKD